jgi:hypothetical protein
LKVPRQCPLFLIVEVRFRDDKALGSEKDEGLGCGLCYEQRREIKLRLYCV